jgi:hypothetical protein
MKSLKMLFLFGALGAFLIGGCKKDDDDQHGDNEITIRILEPADGAVISDPSNVSIHIEVEASDENHEVEIVLYPHGNSNDKIIDFDQHAHDKIIVFQQAVDLSSYPSGTDFHLEVNACKDEDCTEKETKGIEFSI